MMSAVAACQTMPTDGGSIDPKAACALIGSPPVLLDQEIAALSRSDLQRLDRQLSEWEAAGCE